MYHCVTPLHISTSLGQQPLLHFATDELDRGQQLGLVEQLCDLVDRHDIFFVDPGGHYLTLCMTVTVLNLLGPCSMVFLLDVRSSGRCATLDCRRVLYPLMFALAFTKLDSCGLAVHQKLSVHFIFNLIN